MFSHHTTGPDTTHSRRTSLPAQHIMHSPNSMFSRMRSKSISNIGYRRPSSVPFSPLYQSSTITPTSDDMTDAKANAYDFNFTLPAKNVTFSGRNIIDAYTPISEHSNTSVSVSPPFISRCSSRFSNSSMSRMSTIASRSYSTLSSASYTNIHSPLYRPSLLTQNSPVFRRPRSIPEESHHATDKVKPCPNIVNDQCRCKEKLSENHAAQLVWSECYRPRIRNNNCATAHREIEVSYFDGLYKGLCQYFRQEIDSDRIPTKRDISKVIQQQFGGFTLDNGEVIIDRCHFVSLWRWFHDACQILKDIYNLWDTKYPFQLNLFMDRKKSEEILRLTDDGTFLVRLSSRRNALVVSYSEKLLDGTTKVRHILFVRKSSDRYMVKTNSKSHKCSEISKLIRSFAKLKFIYTPNCIYNKKHVF